MIIRYFLFVILTPITLLTTENNKATPTIDDLLRIKTVREAQISPDGRWVAYSIREADFEQDAYVTQIWLVDSESGETFQLTRNEKSASNPKWSPDGKWLAFTSSRNGGKNQIYAISPVGGEAVQLTASETGVNNHAWSPDGAHLAYSAQAEDEKLKKRSEQVGDFFVVRKEYRFSHLWVVDHSKAMRAPTAGTQITTGEEYSVGSFAWSHDGTRIVFDATINPDRIHFHTADLFVFSFDDSTTTKLVDSSGPDWNPEWSPDDSHLVFSTYSGKELFYAFNSNLAVIPARGGKARVLTDAFDEIPRFVSWHEGGLYFRAYQRTDSHLFRLHPEKEEITRVTAPDRFMGFSFSFTSDAQELAFIADSPTQLREVYVSDIDDFSPRKLTDLTEQTASFSFGTRQLVSWKSKDGTAIEGVLIKPPDFDPSKKHPLLCVIHGGPTGIDRPALLAHGLRTYPVDIWANRGALILMVNYRGSAGYGEEFRRLNYRNLGVGDAWDVISGVDDLVEKGWVDSEKVGCMGWSQGGYISAFLTTSSDRFAAVSVGAGISNWATYYYNTDITPFTINYLGDDPVDDPKIYEKTSPMAYVKNAKTPTLIQHGEFDKRVPTPNAYELRQGLEDRGVPVEMIVYKGFGHGINKPKAQRAVMWHNLKWFNHHLWGDALPSLSEPELPEEAKSSNKKT